MSKKKFTVDYSDPHVDTNDRVIKKLLGKANNVKIDKNIKNYDCVALITDHDAFNYKLICKYSKILIDTRNKINRSKNFYKL